MSSAQQKKSQPEKLNVTRLAVATSTRAAARLPGEDAYRGKSEQYFSGARIDYLSELPRDRTARVLEIGCGFGETGALALSSGKCASYSAVEICEDAAAKAKLKITEVVAGNIESVNLPWGEKCFDVLILSEVLEHLVDPWSVLRKIRPLMKPGARVFASSPNVSHFSVLRMLLRGDWTLGDSGLMDRTHLRWFTPRSYRELFESTGYRVDSVQELAPFGKKAKFINKVTFGRLRHLLTYQIDLRAHCL